MQNQTKLATRREAPQSNKAERDCPRPAGGLLKTQEPSQRGPQTESALAAHLKVTSFTRRQAMFRTGLVIGATLTGAALRSSAASANPGSAPTGGRFLFCLNTGTIRGQKLGLAKEIEVAAKAGYQAIEPWVASIEEFAKSGGSLKELRQRIADLGLTV